MQCSTCKHVLDDDSRFCKHCGQRVSQATYSHPKTAAKAVVKEIAPANPEHHRDPHSEKAVWEGRPSWRAHYGIWGCWAIFSIVAIVMAYRRGGVGSPIVLLTWILVAGAASALFVREALVVYGTAYRLTTQRLFIHRGILRRTTDQVELLRVDDVRIVQGIIDRLVNTGNVEIHSSDESEESVALLSIAEPAEVCEALRIHTRTVRNKGFMAVESV